MKLGRKKNHHEVVELNITAFMDLMVALICFLLITAVFARMTVVDLKLPDLNTKNPEQQEIKLALQLVIREKSFDIQDVNIGLIRRIDRDPSKPDWKIFNKVLLEIKYRFPDEQDITLLLEPNVDYKTMIDVMDHIRSTDIVNTASLQTVELFPNISIGDAPELVAPVEVLNAESTSNTELTPEQNMPEQEVQPAQGVQP
jgi:biopolymer transport protein ExbD